MALYIRKIGEESQTVAQIFAQSASHDWLTPDAAAHQKAQAVQAISIGEDDFEAQFELSYDGGRFWVKTSRLRAINFCRRQKIQFRPWPVGESRGEGLLKYRRIS